MARRDDAGTRAPAIPRVRARAKTTLAAGVAVLVGALALTLFLTDALRGPELGSVDQRFAIRGAPPEPRDVAVVVIDAATFDAEDEGGVGLQWPFPRETHAKVIDRLRRDGARVIAVDIQFTERTDVRNDSALIAAIDRAPRIALATTEVAADGSTRVLGGDEVLKTIGARAGNALFPNDPGGVIRRMHRETQGLATLPIATAELASGEQIVESKLGGPSAWIDYRGPPGAIRTVSYADVFHGRFAAGTFRGRVVVVGPSAPSLQDVHPTSTATQNLMSGAEIQANAVWTALHGFPLQPLPRWLAALIIVAMGIAAPLGFLALGARRCIVAVALLGVAYAVVAQLLFGEGTIMPFVYPLGALGLGLIAVLGLLVVTSAFERERVRDMFSRFVPEAVVHEVLDRTDEDLRLGGERRVATVMFSDLRGFTSYAESCPPDEVIDVLNRYLTAMSDIILDHGGTLVAYMGDGIMAVFGAPIEQDDHADRALAAAREMAGPALEAFNEWMASENVGPGFRMGVGINSGVVMSGNVGSQRRLEYTAIGDTTNTAARLEGMTKGTPYMVFVADSTRSMLHDEALDLVHVDRMEVRGKKAPISVWGIPDRTSEVVPPAAGPA
nr:adenylate/guanylate cyclase domain-containing protein [Solirubrobacterales bacterium]